ncbi:hypothetical protein ACSBR2_013342 [Camellia fascicularis]
MSSIFWKNFYICFSKFKCPLQEEDHNHPSPTTSSSTLINTFNSLHHLTSTSTSTSTTTTTTTTSDDFFSSSSDSDTADFAAIFASQRFFFPSPGLSNSIIDSPENSPPPPPPQSSSSDTIVAGSVAIRTYSPDPYSDFRQSMQEMIEARQLMDLKADWDYLHELLLCYLTLNPKHAHKFIISAFSDLLISLGSSTTTDHSRRKSKKQPRSAALPQLL